MIETFSCVEMFTSGIDSVTLTSGATSVMFSGNSIVISVVFSSNVEFCVESLTSAVSFCGDSEIELSVTFSTLTFSIELFIVSVVVFSID